MRYKTFKKILYFSRSSVISIFFDYFRAIIRSYWEYAVRLKIRCFANRVNFLLKKINIIKKIQVWLIFYLNDFNEVKFMLLALN